MISWDGADFPGDVHGMVFLHLQRGRQWPGGPMKIWILVIVSGGGCRVLQFYALLATKVQELPIHPYTPRISGIRVYGELMKRSPER